MDDINDLFMTKGLESFNNTKKITKEETEELIISAKNNNKEATWELIKNNLRLISSIANKYTGYGIEKEDLIQEGCIGMMEAIKVFDINSETKFTTFAYYYIRKNIRETIIKKSKLIKVPMHKYELLIKYRQLLNRFYKENGCYAKTKEISKLLNITKEEVYMLEIINQNLISIEEPTNENTEVRIKDTIAVPINEYNNLFLKEELIKLLNKTGLKEIEKEIVKYRYGFHDNKEYTLKEIATIFNITTQYVSLIEKNALKRIKGLKYTKDLKVYLEE